MSGFTAICYARVSTDEQGASGLGLAAQRDRLIRECEHRGWAYQLLEDVQSASTLTRPALQHGLEALAGGEAQALMVAKLDRLSRSVIDLASLMERARREGWAIVALDLGVDMTSPHGELVANVMGAVAQWERRAIAERTRDALRAKRSQGVRLGRPPRIAPDVDAQVHRLHAQGLTYRQIAEQLTVRPPGGGRWQPSTIGRILRREVTV